MSNPENPPAICHCGTATHSPHVVGENGCVRFITDAPQPFADDPELNHPMWLVDGQLITDFTLRQQRGYHQHENGQWSRWGGSVNSISDDT